jgi:hypothetical protein
MTDATNSTNVVPLSERTIPVHKQDCEGVLYINAVTGLVQQPIEERPEWADGLACALTAERHGWYSSRLGAQYAAEHRHPEAYAYEDLGWLAINEEGEEFEIEADSEHRMEIIATVAGLDREEGTFTGANLTEVELSLDRTREAGEVAALEKAQEEGFEAVRGDGTNG